MFEWIINQETKIIVNMYNLFLGDISGKELRHFLALLVELTYKLFCVGRQIFGGFTDYKRGSCAYTTECWQSKELLF